MFVIGKIQNLRVALRALREVEVPADATFSFWRQAGRATRRRGFVVGRELREGCLIPSIGGGLCQLSNAIYDCAVRAGLEVLERHRHSQVLPGSLAEHDRDATVFWNYIDLRLRAPFAWRLEMTMDAERLRVRIRGVPATPTAPMPVAIASPVRKADRIDDCYSCGRDECHRHVGSQRNELRSLWWLSSPWPEFVAHLANGRRENDRIFGSDGRPLPQRRGWRRLHEAGCWRLARWQRQPLPQIALQQARREAAHLIRRLRIDDVRVVVPQGLLPFLWREGALAGRRFEVWMSAAPMAVLQQQLDLAAQRHPRCHSLKDFRVDHELMTAEAEALAAADAWISPHAQVCQLAGHKAHALAWRLPAIPLAGARSPSARPRVFFPASPLARKGILELLDAMRGEPVDLLLPPGESEPTLDSGQARLRRMDSYSHGLREADVVALPAWVEHQPRGLLAAMAAGLPVVATAACGLPKDGRWTPVREGDSEGLRDAVLGALATC